MSSKALLAAVVVAVASAPAQATIVTLSSSGTVIDGEDLVGAFGPVGSLGGLSYQATFVFDTAFGIFDTEAGTNRLFGGSDYGESSPLVSARLTINGASFAFGGANVGQAFAGNLFGYNFLMFRSTNVMPTPAGEQVDELSFNAENFAGLIVPSLLQNRTYLAGAVNMSGSFSSIVYDGGNGITRFTGNLAPDSVSVSFVASGVPEPSTWAMMLVGFAGLGLASARRRRRSVTAA
jgi:hypothetical protein